MKKNPYTRLKERFRLWVQQATQRSTIIMWLYPKDKLTEGYRTEKGMSTAIDDAMNGPDCLEAQECRGDFWLKLEEAMVQAHGSISVERIARMSLKDVVNVLAQNGIRMTYSDEWHIDRKAA